MRSPEASPQRGGTTMTPPSRDWLRRDAVTDVLAGRTRAFATPPARAGRAQPTLLPAGRKPVEHPRRVPAEMTDDRAGRLDAEELAILSLIAHGLALDSVAVRVGMSPRTVRRRIRSVCDRVGVAHPIQAVVWAARRGLI